MVESANQDQAEADLEDLDAPSRTLSVLSIVCGSRDSPTYCATVDREGEVQDVVRFEWLMLPATSKRELEMGRRRKDWDRLFALWHDHVSKPTYNIYIYMHWYYALVLSYICTCTYKILSEYIWSSHCYIFHPNNFLAFRRKQKVN